MHRKGFLGSITALLTSAFLPASVVLRPEDPAGRGIRVPPFLKPGDLIGITTPAGAITEAELQPALERLQLWGYRVRLGTTIGRRDFTFGGTDEERRADLQALLDDAEVKAILCARGGYGSGRIVDALNWERFRRHPKWVIGFSDITVLHSHIHHHCRVATLHAKMCNSFPDIWDLAEPIQRTTIESIRDALEGKPLHYTAPAHPSNRKGLAAGVLVGGNLKMIEHLAGTPSDIDTRGKILFVEDTGEYLYSIDRMFSNLQRTGKLDALAGLVVGGFRIRPDDPGEAFGRTLYDIVLEKTRHCSYPVCFDFPVGHQRANFALKCGVRHRLDVSENGTLLTDQL